ncbi:uncharacterized protein PHACADRAFT_255484 [Phanerochaete carnosa HHB-10118-sp]|uniref:Uncharacterized protein n=1 Tax=Phanerochaete carnosa (strain HHB-10118-sp) TaxID=650164 RepID=K5UYA2_PHACS|nr:uncharacterized protein PHACADRAFT_255484 [Phanerochaete carnosa HHB-10118-sp]EKM55106.1 hypothetical protein PHACADRAFT_255484 [Phanerochaete carnosa HHB-10118-sp]
MEQRTSYTRHQNVKQLAANARGYGQASESWGLHNEPYIGASSPTWGSKAGRQQQATRLPPSVPWYHCKHSHGLSLSDQSEPVGPPAIAFDGVTRERGSRFSN